MGYDIALAELSLAHRPIAAKRKKVLNKYNIDLLEISNIRNVLDFEIVHVLECSDVGNFVEFNIENVYYFLELRMFRDVLERGMF